MNASNEEFLYVLLWTADTLMRPTWRDLNDGFEAWAWRNRRAPTPGADFSTIRDWARAERSAWTHAMRQDPFLPAALLPRGYLGQRTWEQHRLTLARLAPELNHAATRAKILR